MTIGVSPTFELGPISLAWHGVMSALGLLVGLGMASYLARRSQVDREPLFMATLAAAAGGLVGARLFYLAQADPSALLTPWSGGFEGFAFYGAILLGVPAAVVALRLTRQPIGIYLDLIAAAFPFGMAVGRIGDLLNGEHYGSPTDLPWGVTYSSSQAHVPMTGVAYESGALYEIVFAAVLAIIILVARRGLSRPGQVFWVVLGLYSLGRFLIFFIVQDVPVVALGLRQAQWTSLGLVLASAAGLIATVVRPSLSRPSPPPAHA